MKRIILSIILIDSLEIVTTRENNARINLNNSPKDSSIVFPEDNRVLNDCSQNESSSIDIVSQNDEENRHLNTTQNITLVLTTVTFWFNRIWIWTINFYMIETAYRNVSNKLFRFVHW